MLGSALRGEWAEVGKLFAERQSLLANLVPESDEQQIRRSFEVNATLLSHARDDRDAVSGRLDTLRKGRSIKHFYKSNSGS